MGIFVVADVSVQPTGPILKGQAIAFAMRRKPKTTQPITALQSTNWTVFWKRWNVLIGPSNVSGCQNSA
jgi:hypothetical protein